MSTCVLSRVVRLRDAAELFFTSGGRPESRHAGKVERVVSSAGRSPNRYSGSLEPRAKVDLAFRVGGYVEALAQINTSDGVRPIDKGDFVKKGTVLARVRAADYSHKLKTSEAQLGQARAEFFGRSRASEPDRIAAGGFRSVGVREQREGLGAPAAGAAAFRDQPKQVEENVDLFMSSLYEAIVLVVLVALIGFWEWRSALLMALSIPITLAMTFGLMRIVGIDVQQVSIASLIIALGLLVDDPVVAGDAIKRDPNKGWPGVIAAWLGPTKLATAILFATITNIVPYLPFLTLSGDSGRFIHSLPIVLTASLVASRLVSMTFIPLLGFHCLDAGILRLRPVLVTVGATVLGLIPLALHGGPLWEPLCFVQIGGLTAATVVTLVLVPVLYAVFVLDLKLVKWHEPEPQPPRGAGQSDPAWAMVAA